MGAQTRIVGKSPPRPRSLGEAAARRLQREASLRGIAARAEQRRAWNNDPENPTLSPRRRAEFLAARAPLLLQDAAGSS